MLIPKNIRIVRIDFKGKTEFIIEKKFLFFWMELYLPDAKHGIHRDTNIILNRAYFRYSTYEKALAFLVNYKIDNSPIKYRGYNIIKAPYLNRYNIFETMYICKGIRQHEPSYASFRETSYPHYHTSIDELKNKIDSLLEKPKRTIIKPKMP